MKKAQFKGQTPNALPPTVVNFGERMGSLTLKGARMATHIDTGTIGGKDSTPEQCKKYGYPYHWLDIWGLKPDGDTTILLRSKNLHINSKQLRAFERQVTRKLAVFLFETKNEVVA